MMFAFAWPCLAAGQQPFPEEQRPRFTLVCDEECPPLVARMALDAAETAWDESLALLGVLPPEPEAPLAIHIYRNPANFEAAEERLVGGGLRPHRSFAHEPTRTAHIALQAGIPDVLLRRYGPTPRTLRLVAHEAFHLVTFEALAGAAFLPEWLAEGGATWVEQRVAERLEWSRGLTEDPVPSTYLWLARRMLHRGLLPTARELLAREGASSGESDEYALAMLLMTHLREDRATDLDEVFQAVARLDASDPAAPVALGHAVERALGGPEFSALDRSFRGFLAARRPGWVEVTRSLETGGPSWVQVGLEREALAWRIPTTPDEALTLEGVVELLAGGDPLPSMRVVLEEEGGGWLELAFGHGGRVEVSRVDPGQDAGSRERLLAVGIPSTRPLRGSLPFRVQVRDGAVDVAVAGETVASLPSGSLRGTGSWGLGTGPGTVGVWHNLRAGRPTHADVTAGWEEPGSIR
jgi:hypothetical protein